jgi:hypothetical protein
MCATRNRDFVHGLSCGTPIAFETAISTKRIRHANHRSHRFRKHSKLTSLFLYIKRATDALGKKESGKKRKWREPEARRGFYTSLLQEKVTSRRRSGKGPKRSWRVCFARLKSTWQFVPNAQSCGLFVTPRAVVPHTKSLSSLSKIRTRIFLKLFSDP